MRGMGFGHGGFALVEHGRDFYQVTSKTPFEIALGWPGTLIRFGSENSALHVFGGRLVSEIKVTR